MCSKLFKNGVDIEEFRLFVINQFPPGDCIPPTPASLNEIFEAITKHGLWNFFHYSPLVRIAAKFGAGDPEMDGWVKTYKKDVKAYRLVTTVEDFIETDLEVADSLPAKRAKYDCCPVEWKTPHIDHTLQHLAEVWEMFSTRFLVPDSPPTALLDRVRRGCFVITWLIPSGLISTQVIERMKSATEFFQQHHIQVVTVGGECVHEKPTQESTGKPRWRVYLQSSCCLLHSITSLCQIRINLSEVRSLGFQSMNDHISHNKIIIEILLCMYPKVLKIPLFFAHDLNIHLVSCIHCPLPRFLQCHSNLVSTHQISNSGF